MIPLNDLLAQAKAAAKAFEPYTNTTEGEAWKPLYRQRRDEIESLYNAMSKAIADGKTIVFTIQGEENLIGTIGLLSNVSFLYYSSAMKARYTMQGVDLLAVDALEVVTEAELRLKIEATKP